MFIIIILILYREPTTSEGSISPASSMSMMEEKEVEEIVKNLPEGCGMKGKCNKKYFLILVEIQLTFEKYYANKLIHTSLEKWSEWSLVK